MPPRTPRPVARCLAAVTLAALCWAGSAIAAPSSDDLRGVQDRLEAQDAALAAQLDAEQATLSGGRARLDRARAGYATARRGLEKRLVALYVTPEPNPLIEVITGADLGEIQARLDLLEALGRSDLSLVARYRSASARLRVTEGAARRRKDDLVLSRRDLAVERRMVAMEIAAAEKREKAAQEAADAASAAALPVVPDPTSPPDAATGSQPSPTDRGLSADLLAGRALPGDAPVDAASGVAVNAEPAPAGPP